MSHTIKTTKAIWLFLFALASALPARAEDGHGRDHNEGDDIMTPPAAGLFPRRVRVVKNELAAELKQALLGSGASESELTLAHITQVGARSVTCKSGWNPVAPTVPRRREATCRLVDAESGQSISIGGEPAFNLAEALRKAGAVPNGIGVDNRTVHADRIACTTEDSPSISRGTTGGVSCFIDFGLAPRKPLILNEGNSQ